MAAARPDPPRAARGIVFDLDGTLIDSFDAITASVNHARAAFDLEPLGRDGVLPHVGRGLEPLLADLVGEDHVAEAVRLFREHYAATFAERTALLPDVEPTLAELRRRGYRMAVASNKPARFGAPILETLGVLRYFDDVQGPDLAGCAKPEPSMIRRCLAAMGCDAAAACYVGDMPLDLESARRAGLPAVLVAGGAFSRAALLPLGAPVLERFRDLLGHFGEQAEAVEPAGART